MAFTSGINGFAVDLSNFLLSIAFYICTTHIFCDELAFHHLVAGCRGIQARNSSNLLYDSVMCTGNRVCLSAKLFQFYIYCK